MYHSPLQPARLVLASASPRRRELLARAGYDFVIMPADVDERRLDGETPSDYVSRLALSKAEVVAGGSADSEDRIVLGADTIVVVDEDILAKPEDTQDARGMLKRLSGRSHDVLTGVALIHGPERRGSVERTQVTMIELDDETIEWYLATGESRDKAGAYGVQGIASRFIERIEGSYSNVVGIPMTLVDRLLSDICLGRI